MLITYGQNAPEIVESILRGFLPLEKKVSELQKGRQLLGKATSEDDSQTRNAAKVAVEVASNLSMPGILQTAALQSDPTIRTTAVRNTYYLWQRDSDLGFAILEYLSEYATRGLLPNVLALESVLGLSLVIFFEHYRDERTLRRLQSTWHRIIAKLLRIREDGNRIETIIRSFIRERIFSFVTAAAFRLFRELPEYNIINYSAVEAFFQLSPTQKKLFQNLVQYINVEESFPRAQMENDYIAATETTDLLICLVADMSLIAHASNDPAFFLSLLKKLFTRAENYEVPTPYVTDIANVVENVLARMPVNDQFYELFMDVVPACQDYYVKYPHALRNTYSDSPEALYLGCYIDYYYQRNGTARAELVKRRIRAALADDNIPFFRLLLTSELPLVGIERGKPLAALDAVALFINSDNDEIHQMIQSFLARLRIYYLDEVDDFLEEQRVSDDFRLQVRTNEPAETIGALIGMRSWYFLRDDVIMNSPPLRSHLISVMSKVADCKNTQTWFNYFIRELINLTYGEEALRQSE